MGFWRENAIVGYGGDRASNGSPSSSDSPRCVRTSARHVLASGEAIAG